MVNTRPPRRSKTIMEYTLVFFDSNMQYSEAILYAVSLLNCGSVELCTVAKVQKFVVTKQPTQCHIV